MGFLKSLISDAIGDGIRKAVGDATEKAFAPVAERVADKAAEKYEEVADTAVSLAGNAMEAANAIAGAEIILRFPMWTYSEVQNLSKDETDEHLLERISVDLTDEAVEAYQKVLRANGFEGDWQIFRKMIDGKEHIVDFTFVSDSEIQYLIKK